MELVGSQKTWGYFDAEQSARCASNGAIRKGRGHEVPTYYKLARKVAEIQFLNRDHMLLFRGQSRDFKTVKNNSMLKPSIFRYVGNRAPSKSTLEARFERLRLAEGQLISRYDEAGFKGRNRLKRHRIIRWAILQHYEVCDTPLLDVTQSLRNAASFASRGADNEAFVFVLGVPLLSGAVSSSAETGLQTVRLASACPPDAVRPHVQEGYLLGEYPEIADYSQEQNYRRHELDFGRRLVSKFFFNPDPSGFWHSENYTMATEGALFPNDKRDPFLQMAAQIRADVNQRVG